MSGATRTALRVVAAATIVLVVGYCSLIGIAYWAERAYPWTDQPFIFASLHVVNERSEPGTVQWRPKPGVSWMPVLELRSAAERFQQSGRNRLVGTGWLPVGPLLDRSGNEMASAFITVRVGERLLAGAQEYDLEVQPRAHLRLRLVESDQVFVSYGTESWLGSVSFGPEQALH